VVTAQTNPQLSALRLDEPVIVLTCGRSGSTLLRFILDAHPDLACPAETGVVDLCSRMGMLSMILDGSPTEDLLRPSDLALDSIRDWVRITFGRYLVRAGKARWCDKSLTSAELAGRFLQLFPKARFICLYRHCADVIDSMLEACPWGLRGYGLDRFATAHPGSSVAAVADYWVTRTGAIIEFERAYPDACLRVRYEDMVTDPEGQAQRIFGFLGEPAVPGISRAFLPAAEERAGPSDHKIWWTSEVHSRSVGRGRRIPADELPAALLGQVNDLLERLEYPPVGEEPEEPAVEVSRPSGPGQAGEAAPAAGALSAPDSGGTAELDGLGELLAARVAVRHGTVGMPSRPQERMSFVITATMPAHASGGGAEARSWRIDLGTGRVVSAGLTAGPGEWGVTGTAQTWRSVLAGELNFGTAMRQGHLRYTGVDKAGPQAGAPGNTARTRLLSAALAPPRRRRPVSSR
jgi:hypothetical protein